MLAQPGLGRGAEALERSYAPASSVVIRPMIISMRMIVSDRIDIATPYIYHVATTLTARWGPALRDDEVSGATFERSGHGCTEPSIVSDLSERNEKGPERWRTTTTRESDVPWACTAN